MDRNQSIGLFLMSALLLVYMFFFSEPPQQQQPQPQPVTDTLSSGKNGQADVPKPVVLSDSLLQQRFGFFALGMKSQEAQDITLENAEMAIVLSPKGGKVKQVTLKKHVDQHKQPLVLMNEGSTQMQEWLPTPQGPVDLNTLNYTVSQQGNVVVFSLSDSVSKLERRYELPAEGYVLKYGISHQNLPLAQGNIQFNWKERMRNVEQDLETTRIRATVNYYTVENDFDQLNEASSDPESEKLEKPAKWVSMKNKFFNSALITDQQFENVSIATTPTPGDLVTVKQGDISLEIPMASVSTANLRYFFGPNDYDLCGTIAPGFEDNAYLGWAIFMPVSLYVIIPMFQFLEQYIANYGIIIFILVALVKLALFPLTYKSYISMAKMRVLKPEMDAIREQYGEDMQKIQQESMKVQSQFGVSPLSGCIPVLAQMPITIALFTFFPNAIQLRQQSFLWATDLSSYDSIATLPFEIPFYGQHVSLFTLLMTAVTLVSAYYNNQMNSSSAAMQGPMKYMAYIMPVMFLFFLNSFSSGLTYYYFLSTTITVGQQIVSGYMIDEKAIRAKLDDYHKNNKGKKSFMERMTENMRNQQAEVEKRKQESHSASVARRLKKGGDNGKAS